MNMQVNNRTYTVARRTGLTPHVTPITGSGPVDSTISAGGGDLLNHYFVEALMRRLEELEKREHERMKEVRKEHSEDFQSWLKVPANEQDGAQPVNKFTREKAINSYRKTASFQE